MALIETLKVVWNKLFNTNKDSFQAKEAYMLAKYGRIYTEEQLYERIVYEINETVKSKIISTKYSLSYDMDPHFMYVCDKVITYYESRGFQVALLTNESIGLNISNNYLFICWEWKS